VRWEMHHEIMREESDLEDIADETEDDTKSTKSRRRDA
jgi:hypothetical protein